MKVELEIISDRLPTEADGSKSGMVFVVVDGVWSIWHWRSVQAGMRWARIPTPKPPIDTSLAASIERLTAFADDIYDEGNVSVSCDIHRIIEAARKWDEHCRAPKTLGYENGSIIIGVPGSEDSQ